MMLERDWRTNDPGIDAEHDKFFALFDRLRGVLRTSDDENLAREAVSTIFDRMMLHSRTEEDFLRRRDVDVMAVLAEDHQTILQSLKRLGSLVGKVPKAALLDEVEIVHESIMKHEREVDVPMFRLVLERP